ncbi:MAG: NAD-binding protein [Propionibacteriaceae bacterium]|jgi:Trk K+ transport system NAD-binding subunit|nr:NAD-binding protein [Propionibacteriaceae bacterium]
MAAIFIVLRKMRRPLLLMLAIMTFSVIGLSMMPGVVQPDGSSGRLNAFEAFYVFSYTATTIGFGEVPHAFSVEQRWWVVASIYLSVVVWAYTIARLMSLLQDAGFIAAYTAQSVRRTITHMRQPFTIVVGYGYIGRSVVRTLDARGRRAVVLDQQPVPIERLATDMLAQEVPGIWGDARNPAILGLAGLDHEECEAVLALTGDEEVNLQIVMTCSLLRPGLPVIARATSRQVAAKMADFSPLAIINPFDDYGQFLMLELQRPYTHRLIHWLMASEGTSLGPISPRFQLQSKKWLVVADGHFGDEVTQDLIQAGYTVTLDLPDAEHDFTHVAAVIAGAESDTANMALAAHLRHAHPDIVIVVRQQSHAQLPLVEAFCPDSIFFPPQLVTQRAVANLTTPRLWEFIRELMTTDDESARRLTESMVARLGNGSPSPMRLWISETHAPTVVRWLTHHRLTLRALFRSPQDWTQSIAAYPVLLIRDGVTITLPDEGIELELDDEIVMVGTSDGFAEQDECLNDDSTLYYTATGHDIPTSGLWRRITGRLWKDAFEHLPIDPASSQTQASSQPEASPQPQASLPPSSSNR